MKMDKLLPLGVYLFTIRFTDMQCLSNIDDDLMVLHHFSRISVMKQYKGDKGLCEMKQC